VNGSEIARLRHQIELECEAVQRGLFGFAAGAARHIFIQKRMEQLRTYQDELSKHVGNDEAAQIVAELYTNIVEK